MENSVSDTPSDAPRSRSFRFWTVRIAAAVGAIFLLVAVLKWEEKRSTNRWSTLVEGSPRTGEKLFEAKGCSSCHTGAEAAPGPNLSVEKAARSGPDHLVTAMWNHAPKMWDRMHEAGVVPPAFTQQEMADLLAYLYTLRYVGAAGDEVRGERLFARKGCASCHNVRGRGSRGGKDLSTVGSATTAVGFATAMWNHPRNRGESAASRFDGVEANDILSYMRGGGVARQLDHQLVAADFQRGWTVFREKSCMACHSVKDEAGHVGPELGPARELPATVVQLGGAIWNHSPAMWDAMEHLRIQRPTFLEREMADLVAFLYSFRYAEPGGSPKVGEVLFEARGCSRCHGPLALGTREGPELRGRGKSFTSVTMAAALWRHGPAMFRRTRDLGLPWPLLAEKDVGDLISFLNTSPEPTR
ncbi:MAG TPA: c-type cytochrome [Thermoanaerobaculia bacterium]|nr:c-type cytochrome [Thermoanaerobaculia bacterium]